MDIISILGIATGISATLVTIVNVFYVNAATIQAELETLQIPKAEFVLHPKNKLGPEFLPGMLYYLSLKIKNDGPGVAKKISWKINKWNVDSSEVRSETGVLPYLGRAASAMVREHIECATTVETANKLYYEVLIHFKPIFGIKEQNVTIKFDGSGVLKNYKLAGKIIKNFYEEPVEES